MPTGYTAQIADGISFEDFVMGCARAFGACITMRDDPHDTPIPDKFEPSDYHVKALTKAGERLSELQGMTPEEAQAGADEEFKNEVIHIHQQINEMCALRDKYRSMLSCVRAWQPPTADHTGLKDFMIEQINGSIEFDCDPSYYNKKLETLQHLTGEEWRSVQIRRAMRDIAYHSEENTKEVDRANQRTQWVSDLRKSLATQ